MLSAITGLSLSEANPGVYHNGSLSEASHMYRISDTAHVPVYLCKVTPLCHLHHKLSERISDTLMGQVLFAGFATRGCFG